MNTESPDLQAEAASNAEDPAALDAAAPPAELSAEERAAAEAEAARKQAEQEAEDKAAAEREARHKRLMQKIAKQADFASMKDSVRLMQKISRSENAHARALSGAISEDIAMTAKLLRLVNAAFYSAAGGGNITSLQRAVALMGFQTVGMMANSLMLFDRLPKGADGNRLREEFGRAQLAALLAQQFCNRNKAIEGSYLAALFQNLGGMLGGLHFPEDLQSFEEKLAARGLTMGKGDWMDARDKLAREHWGVDIEDIAIDVAGQWGWPESVRNGMRRLQPSSAERAASPEEYQRVLCTAANVLAAELLGLPSSGSAEEKAEARRACVERFAAEMAVPLSLDPEPLVDEVAGVQEVWDDLAKVLGFGPVAAPPVAKKPKEADLGGKPGVGKVASAAGSSNLAAAAKPAPPRPVVPAAPVNPAVAESLSNALEKLSGLVLSGAPPGQLLQLCMKQMHEALNLRRVVVCLRDPSGSMLKGGMGVGERATALAPVFQIPLQPPSELFGLLCSKGADTLISDTADPVIAQRLPAWFRNQVQAGTFVLLPMVAGGQVLGAFYGDKADAGTLQISERELTLLKTLRNQVVMALRFGAGNG
ncbi:HDOD domain-containing protein [Roseateles oligotrophus]|uniref:HDOD domain-containing protein n=1 Tax=Roseateles oligotrophus TaxID=1769250 RepID=A0ABT2YCR9_9BURK|nr:HDOD domain-containing protein [Roseateles oligotrophus]MCV2367834.1 HDOD domain-containing protein [Roseateles oligotrophus]